MIAGNKHPCSFNRLCLPTHLLAHIFDYVPCSGGEKCECDPNSLDICMVTNDIHPPRYPSCEWHRKLLAVGTESVRDAMQFIHCREPCSLQFEDRLQDDKSTVLNVIQSFEGTGTLADDVEKFISPRLLDDIEIVTALIDRWDDLAYTMVDSGLMTPSRLDNKDVVMCIIQKNFDHVLDIMMAISPRLRDDIEIAKALLATDDPQAFQLSMLSACLCDNREIVMAVLTGKRGSPTPAYYAHCISKRLKGDKGVVLALLDKFESLDDYDDDEDIAKLWEDIPTGLQCDKNVFLAFNKVCGLDTLDWIVDVCLETGDHDIKQGITSHGDIDDKDVLMAVLARKLKFCESLSDWVSPRLLKDKDVIKMARQIYED